MTKQKKEIVILAELSYSPIKFWEIDPEKVKRKIKKENKKKR